jgi:peptidyl-prolyl cis-trans isomerase A (cyclophilin A)
MTPKSRNRFSDTIMRNEPIHPRSSLTMRRSLIPLALLLAAFATPAFSQSANLASPAALREQAPPVYKAKFDTTKGVFVIEVTREWAPQGADRFYNLVRNGFYDDVRFFRVISGFMVQFGIHGDPKISAPWRAAQIKDDPVRQSNKRGYVTYAMAGPNTRTSQVFINFGDNSGSLDNQGFSPFGRVVSGMEVVDKLHAEYGEGAPRGRGPDQSRMQMEGNAYLTKDFSKLDYVKKATIER